MILATSDDYEYPHIDWQCKSCECVYVSSGVPDTDYCPGGNHQATWKPNNSQIRDYIEFLESLEYGDGLVVCGEGPAPLMGPVETFGRRNTQTEGPYNYVVTDSIDSPARIIRWGSHEKTIEFAKADSEHKLWRDVYHVESVEIQTATVEGAQA